MKVLDFGLAKATEPAGAMRRADSISPTITSPAMMTGVGMILGTAAYMSPEQARGKPVDRRADIWAFGCVLYEMLTGKRAFQGEDVTDTIAAVVKEQPDLTRVPVPARQVARVVPGEGPEEAIAGDWRYAPADGGCAAGRPPFPAAVWKRRMGARRSCRVRGGRAGTHCTDSLPRGAARDVGDPRDDSSPGQHNVRLRSGPRSTRAVARRTTHRVRCADRRWRYTAVGSLAGHVDGAASSRHRRRDISLLVARRPVHRLFRGRQAQEDRRLGRPGADADGCAARARRKLEPRRRHCFRGRQWRVALAGFIGRRRFESR